VEDGGLMHWRVLTLGRTNGSQVEVLSGLNHGDVVVVNPGSQELDGKKAGAAAVLREKRS
jgi:multidrug efflux pump subunit AcrA (membrane-fusion protein)